MSPRDELLAPWRPSAKDWNAGAVAHLFRRAGFGPSPEDARLALDQGLEASVERLFEPPGHDPRLFAGIDTLLSAGAVESLQAWWTSLILGGGDPLAERMALVWHNHFATSWDKVDDVRLMQRQNQLFREHGLGDFRVLLRAVAKDPAMLVWLDGNLNRRGQPNENFARELFELFGLGIGNYDEEDVREAARAFTGWGTYGRSFRYREADHDDGHKRVLGRTGNFDGDALLEIVLEEPACARHIARRLLVELVLPEPSPTEIEALAGTLVASDWHIGRTLRVLFASRLFHSPSARRSRIGAPVEIVASSIRRLGARVSPALAARSMGEMGQALFRPPSVEGWPGGRRWIQASAWLARHNALGGLAEAHLGEEAEGVSVDLARSLGRPGSKAEAVELALAGLLPDLEDDSYRSTLEAAAQASPDVDRALARTTALILTSPEYHLY